MVGIKMDMPANCGECKFCIERQGWNDWWNECTMLPEASMYNIDIKIEKHQDCPLVDLEEE